MAWASGEGEFGGVDGVDGMARKELDVEVEMLLSVSMSLSSSMNITVRSGEGPGGDHVLRPMLWILTFGGGFWIWVAD